MTSKVGAKGQVVIPKEIRDRLGIRPGDDVTFAVEDGAVRVELVRTLEDLGGAFRGYGLTELLEAEHRRELESE